MELQDLSPPPNITPPPTLNTPVMWYIIMYWECLVQGGENIKLGGGDDFRDVKSRPLKGSYTLSSPINPRPKPGEHLGGGTFWIL